MLAGDQASFDEFFDGSFPGLYRFALTRLAGNHDAAEEVAQASICKAIAKLDTYRGEAALFTWLCTFCRYEISDYHRKHRTRQRIDLIEDSPECRAALESLGAAIGQPGQAFDRAEVRRLVQVVLDRLPPHYGRVLEWKYLDEISVREIAARSKVSEKAAESLLTRARNAFRDAFATLAGIVPSKRNRKESAEAPS